MKKAILFLSFAAFMAAGIYSCSSKSTESKTEKASVVYTCPMDKDVVSDKPGKCPKCGMDLVEKK